MKIKSKGPLARYLGICLWTGYYNPRDFCTLFWLLVVSPLLFVFSVLIGLPIKYSGILIVKLLDWREEQLVSNLVKQYQNNKDILFQDYTDHYCCSNNMKLNRRSFDIVRLAMRRYAPEVNKSVSIDTVVSKALSISQAELWTKAQFDISSRLYPKKPSALIKLPTKFLDVADYIVEHYANTLLMLCITVMFMPVGFLEPLDSTFWFVTTSILEITLVIHLYYNSNADKYLKTYYHSFKERTCPIITWEYDS